MLDTLACIKLICDYCANDVPVKKDVIGVNWLHKNGSFCKAYTIHNALAAQIVASKPKSKIYQVAAEHWPTHAKGEGIVTEYAVCSCGEAKADGIRIYKEIWAEHIEEVFKNVYIPYSIYALIKKVLSEVALPAGDQYGGYVRCLESDEQKAIEYAILAELKKTAVLEKAAGSTGKQITRKMVGDAVIYAHDKVGREARFSKPWYDKVVKALNAFMSESPEEVQEPNSHTFHYTPEKS